MREVFLLCLVLGAGALVVQIVLGFLGMDHDAPDMHDVGAGEGLDLLSVRTVAAGAALFGAVGFWLNGAGLPPLLSAPLALVAGSAAAVGTAFLTRQLLRLESDGTLRIEDAVGLPGQVYLPIPAHRAGFGRVQFKLQGRTIDLRAVANEDEDIPTGTSITVVGVIDGDTVEVLTTPLIEGIDV